MTDATKNKVKTLNERIRALRAKKNAILDAYLAPYIKYPAQQGDINWKELAQLDKVRAISFWREIYGVSLNEAKDKIEEICKVS